MAGEERREDVAGMKRGEGSEVEERERERKREKEKTTTKQDTKRESGMTSFFPLSPLHRQNGVSYRTVPCCITTRLLTARVHYVS